MDIGNRWRALKAAAAQVMRKDPKKTVTVKLTVDPKYKWIARQPFGAWVLFANKPVIHKAWDEEYEDGFIPEYWGPQKDELELADFAPQGGDWKHSLKRLK